MRLTRILWLVMLLPSAFGCGGNETVVPTPSANSMLDPSCKLVAHFEKPTAPFPRPQTGGSLSLTIENVSQSTVALDPYGTGNAILGMEWFDASGKQVFTVPPGVPPSPDDAPVPQSLGPGQKRSYRPSLNVFSPPLAKGKYTAKARLPGNCSETVSFEIGG